MAKKKVDLGLWRVCISGNTNHYFEPIVFHRVFLLGKCDQPEAVLESIRLGETFKLEDGRECKRTELIVREKVDELGGIMDRYSIKGSDIVAVTATRRRICFHLEPEAFHRMQDSFADDFDAPVDTENHSPDESSQSLHHRGTIDGVEFVAVENKESKDGSANEV